MEGEDKTKEQLVNEVAELRQRIAELEAAEVERKRVEKKSHEYSGHTRELDETQEQLIRREKLAVLGQLAGGVGHELRTPLGAINNAAYFLNMVLEEPDSEVQEALGILTREVMTADRIISSLLDFARTKRPIRRSMNINTVIRDSLSRVAVPENVEVVTQLDEALPIIQADPDQLGQAFGNLILNGVQAMPDGGRLSIEAKVADQKWLIVSFTDTGVGIPEGNVERVFEPLFTTKPKGIGLGTAIVKIMIDVHGGSVDVESNEGKGTVFTVRLPLIVDG